MKKKNFHTKNRLHRISPSPFPGVEPAEDGLFDDCPLCTELRRDIKAGRAVQLEDEELSSEEMDVWKYIFTRDPQAGPMF